MIELIFENAEGKQRREKLPEIVTGLTPDALEEIARQFERDGWTLKECKK